MKRPGISLRIAFILADRDMSDAPTLGDLMNVLRLRTGTAAGERLREARLYYGFRIKCDRKSNTYWMPPSQRREIKARADYRAWKARAAA